MIALIRKIMYLLVSFRIYQMFMKGLYTNKMMGSKFSPYLCGFWKNYNSYFFYFSNHWNLSVINDAQNHLTQSARLILVKLKAYEFFANLRILCKLTQTFTELLVFNFCEALYYVPCCLTYFSMLYSFLFTIAIFVNMLMMILSLL